MFHPFKNEVDVGLGQLLTLVLGLGVSWVGQPASPPSSSQPRHVLQHCPGYLTQCSGEQGAGTTLLLSHPRARSPGLTPPKLALLFCPSKDQGLFSGLLCLVRGRVSPSVPMPSIAGGKGWVGENIFLLLMRDWGSSPPFKLTGPAHLCPHQQGQFQCAALGRYRTCSLTHDTP